MDDTTDSSATPLDLLLNAITEGGDTDHYDFQEAGDNAALGDLGGLLGEESVYDFSSIEARPEPGAQSQNSSTAEADVAQHDRLRHAISELILGDAASSSKDGSRAGSASGMSTIQVWHPTAAQKSYKNERRLIVPPPFVRASGPIVSSLSSLTLSAVPTSTESAASALPPSASQTHRILSHPTAPIAAPSPLDNIPSHLGKRARGKEQRRLFKEAAGRSGFASGLRMKTAEQVDKDREMLEDGVNFAGLWIGGGDDKKLKIKDFRLVLDVHADGKGRGDAEGSAEAVAGTALAGPASGDASMPSADYTLDPSISDLTNLQALSNPQPPPSPAPASAASPAWTTLSSSPINIVSKPSTKTAKNRSMSSCLSETASFALWVRIHAQAVRTKYMMLDDSPHGARLTSRTGRWTPFKFEMIKRAELPVPEGRVKPDEDAEGEVQGRVLTYGSVVRLVDVHSGTKSETVKLVKVEKNEVVVGMPQPVEGDEEEGEGPEDGQPISELQKIGMIRVDEAGEPVLEDGKRTYLSAPGARLGGGELRDPSEVKWVWIGRGKRVPIDSVTTPAVKEATPSLAAPSTPPPRAVPETLEEVGMEEINDADLAQAFGIPASDTAVEAGSSAGDHAVKTPVPPTQSLPEKVDADGERPTKRLKTKRNALAAAVVAEDEEGGEQTVCTWQGAEKRMSERESKVGKKAVTRKVEVEYVEDWMCWVMGGVEEFTHTFFDPSPDPLPHIPKSISPAPRLLLEPTFPTPSTLQLTLSSIFTSPTPTSRPQPLSVHLGPIGPLAATTWRSTWRATSLKHPARGSATPCLSYDGEVTSAPTQEGGERAMSTFSALVEHTIVLVELPKLEEAVRVMRMLHTQSQEITAAEHHVPPPAISTNTLDTLSANAVPASAAQVDHDAAWMDAVAGFDTSDMDGNEAIRQALQSVSQAAEAAAHAEAVPEPAEADAGVFEGDINLDDPLLQDGADDAVAAGSRAGGDRPSAVNLAQKMVSATTPKRNAAGVIANSKADLESEGGMIPLPIFLVRRESELVFGLGKSVVAERAGEGEWVLRVIDIE